MKITYKCDYALKALLELALNYNKEIVSISELAQIGDIPDKFLEQVLLMLKKGGFVDSKRGINGGYFLARPPGKITIGEVIRFIEGSIKPIACVGRKSYEACKDFESCVFRSIWDEVHTAISLVIDTITFAELVRRVENIKKNKADYNYCI